MSQLMQDILAIAFAIIFCKQLFSIFSCIYRLHKLFDLTTIQAIIIVKQYNFEKNKLQYLYSNLKNEPFSKKLKIEYKTRIAIVVAQSIYISNNKEEKKKRKRAKRAIANAYKDKLENAISIIILIRAQAKTKLKKRTHSSCKLTLH